ncbi:MAG: MiaB/RimO family radical SAM methylthiotransferase [Planctomycetaceae bacterium]|jgi:tRNA-2-methylthio-N6-dimethylallyladenosine synthase|nr:MiaB/RimO family radical SAM methylthiotransferase [Planctomycetaceae bacterium]
MYTFFIETVGCQMNRLDSELAATGLIRAGLGQAVEKTAADVIIFNTCSIRQHAEDKIYSAIGRLKQWKLRKPFGVIGVIGCMAQRDQDKIIKRAPHVDLVLGPGQLDLLAETVYRLLEGKSGGEQIAPEVLVSLQRVKAKHLAVIESFRLFDPERNVETRSNRFQAMVRVMFGCDKFCAYCIVPKVRGPEQSRSPVEILNEVRQLADQGVQEITFIGQTVNSYKYIIAQKNPDIPKPAWAIGFAREQPLRDATLACSASGILKQLEYTDDQLPQNITCNISAGVVRLSDLLYMSSEVSGLRRIKFVTNYPTGMSDELLAAVRDLPKVSKYLHIPVQSGSDNVLKRMKRQYTVSEYCELIGKIHQMIPSAAVTSDFIVGFCGETDAEFEETAELVRYCRFKNSFVFKYSERPDTKSAELYQDDVPEIIKKQRNNDLLAIQDKISLELNKQFIGKKTEILVEEISKNYDNGKFQLSGRTNCDRIVVFDSDNSDLIGQFIEVEIRDTTPFTLFGFQ